MGLFSKGNKTIPLFKKNAKGNTVLNGSLATAGANAPTAPKAIKAQRWNKSEPFDEIGYEVQQQQFLKNLSEAVSDIKDEERKEYVTKYLVSKKHIEEGVPLYLVGKIDPNNRVNLASTELEDLLDFATMTHNNPNYNKDSLLGRIQPQKITTQKSYVIDFYGDLVDSIPEETGAEIFKHLGSFRSVKIGKNLETGDTGLIVSEECDLEGNPIKGKERFISDKEISHIGYEI